MSTFTMIDAFDEPHSTAPVTGEDPRMQRIGWFLDRVAVIHRSSLHGLSLHLAGEHHPCLRRIREDPEHAAEHQAAPTRSPSPVRCSRSTCVVPTSTSPTW